MADVKALLISLLEEEFDLPVIQQGSLSMEEDYPTAFFTFWNNETEDDGFYDNEETRTIWDFEVNYYSTDPAEVNNILLQVKTLLKAEGFIINGVGYDIMSDQDSHTGRGINVLYIDRK